MGIEFGRKRRADDLLWVTIRLTDEAADAVLSVSARTQDGNEIPTNAFHDVEEDEWRVCLPSLAVTQLLDAVATSQDGERIEERSLRINPFTTHLSIGRRSGRAASDRQVGGAASIGQWSVRVDRLVRTSEHADICEGAAEIVDTDAEALEGAVRIRLLDAHGKGVELGAWTCLSDQTQSLPGYPGFVRRRVEFSLRVSADARAVIVWVQPEEAETLPVGFTSLGSRAMARLREAWRASTTSAAHDEGYDHWFHHDHQASATELAMQREARLGREPLVSVVLVVRQATSTQLRESVESVLDQTYGALELLLVCAGTIDRQLDATVRGLELADSRVRSVPLAADFGSAAAASEGIDATTGDFVCLLAEGDTLAPDALFCVARTIVEKGDADLVYTDEDRVARGRHAHPRFKPDFDLDFLLSSNYLGGLVVVRRNLLRELETMGHELDGAEGYYLALYAAGRARTAYHVPRVLLHVRDDGRGQANGVSASAAHVAALKANLAELADHAEVRLSSRVPTGFEVDFDVREEPLVSVIIANIDGTERLERCLSSLRALTSYENYEVVVVEHGSEDPQTFEYYRHAEESYERVRTVYCQGDHRLDLSYALNFGVSRAKGDYLLLLGRDTEVTDAGWMTRLLALCQRQGVGAAAPRLLWPDGTVESCGWALGPQGLVALDRHRDAREEGHLGRSALMHGVSAASIACLMLDAVAYRAVGELTALLPAHYRDADLCLRLRGSGHRVVIDPQVTLVHHVPLVEDEGTSLAAMRALGRLWGEWPYDSSHDPTGNANLDPASAYGVLAGGAS